MSELKRYAPSCLDGDPEVLECTDGQFVLYTDAMEAIRRAKDEVLEEAALAAEGIERNRDWVPGSLYGTLRRETAAAIRALKSEGE